MLFSKNLRPYTFALTALFLSLPQAHAQVDACKKHLNEWGHPVSCLCTEAEETYNPKNGACESEKAENLEDLRIASIELSLLVPANNPTLKWINKSIEVPEAGEASAVLKSGSTRCEYFGHFDSLSNGKVIAKASLRISRPKQASGSVPKNDVISATGFIGPDTSALQDELFLNGLEAQCIVRYTFE